MPSGEARKPKIFRSKRSWIKNCRVKKHGRFICWEWKFACRGREGRPYMVRALSPAKKEFIYASRFAYELFYGKKIKYLATHTCDNVKCVRPSHIKDRTYSDNSKDAWARHPRKEERKRIWAKVLKLGTAALIRKARRRRKLLGLKKIRRRRKNPQSFYLSS